MRRVREAEAARASVRPDRAISGMARMWRIAPRLVGEEFDLAVRAGLSLPDMASPVAQPLATYPRVLVASPACLKANGTPRTVAALAHHCAVLARGAA